MMPIDVKGTLFWLAVVLALLIWMMRGCGSRMDKFREHRQERKEDRQEWWDQRKEERGDRWRWRDRRGRLVEEVTYRELL